MRLLVHDYAGHPFQIQLSREMARRGHDVTHAYAGNLLTPRGALERSAHDPQNLSIVEVAMSPKYRDAKYNFVKRRNYEYAYGGQLAQLVKRLKPDVVISGNTPTEPQWRMIRATKSLGVPFISWVQDFYSLAVTQLVTKKLPLLGPIAGAYYQWLDKRCLRASDAVVSISSDFQSLIENCGVSPNLITTIPNWAPLDEITPRPKQNDWAIQHELADKFVFLYTGTLAMKHNPAMLSQLASRFAGDPAVRIVVISDGPGAAFLRDAKSAEGLKNLILLPFQDFSVMSDVLGAADVVVALLERSAGVFSVPSKVLTYHAAGKPLLGAIPAENLAARIINDQGSGVCVDPDDAQSFVDQAVSLRNSTARRLGMAEAARAYAAAEFDIQRIANRFERVFESALTARYGQVSHRFETATS